MYKKKCPTFRRAGSSVVTSTPDYLAYRAPSGFRLRVSRQTYRSGHSPTLWGQQAFLLGFPVASGSFRSRICIPPVCMSATTLWLREDGALPLLPGGGILGSSRIPCAQGGQVNPRGLSHFLNLLQHTFFRLSRLFFYFFSFFLRWKRITPLPAGEPAALPTHRRGFQNIPFCTPLSLGWLYYSR